MLVSVFYAVATAMMRVALVMFTRWRVEGRRSVPASGAVIVVSNHLSLIDPPLLAASLPRRVVFMAKEEIFHSWIWGWSSRGYGAFPVRRGEPDRKALRQADETLKQGLALGMFPEGTRSVSARMSAAAVGASLIALRSGATILPVAITGTEKITGLLALLSRHRITVTIGEPFTLPSTEGKPTRELLAAATDTMMKRVAELLPESYRGAYGGGLAGALR